MVREISSGGVVVREVDGAWLVALIEPQRDGSATASRGKTSRAKCALPKGLVDPGEKAAETALREVFEETGVTAEIVAKLLDIKYVYVRSWSDGERVFKIVSFYLLRYVSGEIDDVTPAMRIEVKRALWVPLADASRQLMYSGERKVLRQAEEYLNARGLEPQVSEKTKSNQTKRARRV
jgi:ADP-ribose pyrophosphatase YjhB (NUDIX family)